MANSDDENREAFIRERVVGNRRSKKEAFLRFSARVLMAALLAVVFGVVAGAVFAKVSSAVTKGNADNYENETLSIPRDDDTISTSSDEEATETAAEATTQADTKEPFESMIQNGMNGEARLGLDDYTDMYEALSVKLAELDKAVVAVSSKEQRLDWFDNSIETDAVCSGIIWNITDTEILIGAICDFSENAKSIEIEFSDGSFADAYVKGYDSATKLAVLAVSAEDADLMASAISEVKLGNSYVVSEGEPVVMVGSPTGYIGSVLYGHISYRIDNMFIADMSQKGLLTDIYTYEGSNGFVVNYSGELLGLYGADCAGKFTRAYGISDLKGIFEKLSNGDSIACLGVIGRAVTADIASQYELVQGVYVSETVMDEPAYAAGIMNGDIITAIGEEKIFTLYSLQNVLEKHNAGDAVSVKVMRNGAGGYTEIVFDIELGAR